MAFRNRLSALGSVFLAMGLLSTSVLHTDGAAACGGLFCSNSNPVNQAAERIIFSKNEDGTVTAAIEILYEGPAHEFAWVLPVPAADVSVAVSSKQAFDALQQASNPLYQVQTVFEDSCPVPDSTVNSPPSAGNADDSPEQEDSGVDVVASGSAGPYDYTQIAVDPELEDPAQAAVDWLIENEFDVADVGPELLRPYLAEGMNLLAFKLSKGNDSGSIRPVLLNYPGERPTIPIRPTAVAANQDMGVMVWVLGNGRAVPTNYLHLELNEARIDWFNPGPTYNDVIIAAADEAGGQGFVTEQAGPAGDFTEQVYPSYKDQQWTQLRTATFNSMEEFLLMAQNVAQAPFVNFGGGFGGPLGDVAFNPAQNQYDGFVDVLRNPEIVPLREGATPEQLNACVSCYFAVDVPVRNDAYPTTEFDPETDPLLDMNVQAFLDEMERLVIEPLRSTQSMFVENSHVTRFYTTLSADEMTIDPDFDLNPELPDYSNVHTVERVMLCSEEATTEWRIDLPQGVTVLGNGNTWPVELSDDTMPFNFRILQLSTVGEGEVLLDNGDTIIDRLLDLGIGEGGPMLEDPEEPIDDPEDPTDPQGPVEPNDPDEIDDDPAGPTGPGVVEDPVGEDPSEEEPDEVIDDEGETIDDMMGARTSGGGGGCSVASGDNRSSRSPASAWALLGLGLLALRRRRSR